MGVKGGMLHFLLWQKTIGSKGSEALPIMALAVENELRGRTEWKVCCHYRGIRVRSLLGAFITPPIKLSPRASSFIQQGIFRGKKLCKKWDPPTHLGNTKSSMITLITRVSPGFGHQRADRKQWKSPKLLWLSELLDIGHFWRTNGLWIWKIKNASSCKKILIAMKRAAQSNDQGLD